MHEILQIIGQNLRGMRRRQFPDDTLGSFCVRLGINKNTLSAMETGNGNVGMLHYLKAAKLLDCEDQFRALFHFDEPKPSLFDRASSATQDSKK